MNAAAFLQFLLREIPILPIWICPILAADAQHRCPLYPLQADTPYVNFGFWDVIDSLVPQPSGYFNRRIERKVGELCGIKPLYSARCVLRA